MLKSKGFHTLGRSTCTCTCKLFYLLATNHVSVQSYTKYMHHKCVTVTIHSPRFFSPMMFLMPNRQCFFRQGSLQWNSPMFSTANVLRYTVYSNHIKRFNYSKKNAYVHTHTHTHTHTLYAHMFTHMQREFSYQFSCQRGCPSVSTSLHVCNPTHNSAPTSHNTISLSAAPSSAAVTVL